jgi:hypothetical protein
VLIIVRLASNGSKENMRKFNIAEEKLAMRPQHICWAISPLRSIFLTIRA